jgi:hypothetical protein
MLTSLQGFDAECMRSFTPQDRWRDAFGLVNGRAGSISSELAQGRRSPSALRLRRVSANQAFMADPRMPAWIRLFVAKPTTVLRNLLRDGNMTRSTLSCSR